MRYILQSQFADELSHRRAYLYDTLCLWFTVTQDETNNIVLTSMPNTIYGSVLFIVGHNTFVKRYLDSSVITEERVVAITCDGVCDFKSLELQGKELYLPFLNEKGYADLLIGKNYGFDFDLTESEIQFFNAPKIWDLQTRINNCFEKFK